MTRHKLKSWVIPVFGLIILTGSLIFVYLMTNIVEYSAVDTPTMVTDPIIDNNNSIVVNNEIEEPVKEKIKVIKPFTSTEVEINKYYYNNNDEEQVQVKSLIKYGTVYMPNTGILYSSNQEFDVVAILDGKVSNIKSDEILGNIIEVEHDNKIISIYQSVKDVKVKVGDKIKQGDVLAKSGPNKLDQTPDNCLHFESYKDGSLMNPEDLYNLDINSLE